MNSIELGEIIKKRRTYLHITQNDLAEIADIAVHTLSDIESGKGNPTIDLLNKLIDTLGMRINISVKDSN